MQFCEIWINQHIRENQHTKLHYGRSKIGRKNLQVILNQEKKIAQWQHFSVFFQQHRNILCLEENVRHTGGLVDWLNTEYWLGNWQDGNLDLLFKGKYIPALFPIYKIV